MKNGIANRKWQNPADNIRNVVVDPECIDLPYTQEILHKLGDIPCKVLPEGKMNQGIQIHDPKAFSSGKRTLFLGKNKGKFLKSCPGTKEYTCCDYQVLNVGMNCPMDCVYCILQAYLNNPWLSFYVNIDDMLHELDQALDSDKKRLWRIGTGEFTDSLVLDKFTGLSSLLIEYMNGKTNAVLELKTKSVEIDNLLSLPHDSKTILSWSLNSPIINQQEELHTASLEERIAAAVECVKKGYRVGFHFDPIIYHQNWQKGYSSVIEKVFTAVPPESIVWISLGCLRFLPALRSIVTERFPGSHIFSEEFILGLDNKFRYFRTLRVEMYQYLVEKITSYSPDCCIYLCMESEEIWHQVFGYGPEDHGGLSKMLDRAAFD